jgi:hypothetical protein
MAALILPNLRTRQPQSPVGINPRYFQFNPVMVLLPASLTIDVVTKSVLTSSGISYASDQGGLGYQGTASYIDSAALVGSGTNVSLSHAFLSVCSPSGGNTEAILDDDDEITRRFQWRFDSGPNIRWIQWDTSGSNSNQASSVTLTANALYNIVGKWDSGDGGKPKLWYNGQYDGSLVATTNIRAPYIVRARNHRQLSSPLPLLRGSYLHVVFLSSVPDRVCQDLSVNPWQLFAPLPRRIYFGAAAGGGTNVNLTGLGASGSEGSLSQSVALSVTGQSATGSLGAVTPLIGYNVALTGLQATGSLGAFSVSESIALTGQQATGALGTVTPIAGITLALSGQGATGALGSLSLGTDLPLTNLIASGALGTLTPSTSGGTVTINLTGVQANASLGTLTPVTFTAVDIPPVSDVSAGTWLPSVPAAPLYSMIDEAVVNDGDYDYTQSKSAMRVGLGTMNDPGVNYGHRFVYRIKGDGSTTIIARIGAGGTTVATYTHAPAPASLTTYEQMFTDAQVNSFRSASGYTSGWIEFEAA